MITAAAFWAAPWSGLRGYGDEDDRRRHALCLQLLVNAVQVWNARYMTAAIDLLHSTTPDVVADETAIARVAPVTHAHVNSLGR